jgi:hypothetical protein
MPQLKDSINLNWLLKSPLPHASGGHKIAFPVSYEILLAYSKPVAR